MKQFGREQFVELIKEQRIKSRLIRDVRFSDDIHGWENYDMIAVATRSGLEGLLMIQLEDLYLMPYELTVGVRNKQTGRSTPITCDFCSTWQQGAKAGRITFKRPSDKHSFTFLCCGDLKCSLHVRNLTPESILSRTNLREDITTENRIERLKHNLKKVVIMLQVKPIN